MVSSACSSTAPSPPFRERTQDHGCLRVLVVDDDPDAADSLMMLLRVFGHQVRVARDGPTALRLACEDVPELMRIAKPRSPKLPSRWRAGLLLARAEA